jgi:glucose/arabinose dehydrogenase
MRAFLIAVVAVAALAGCGDGEDSPPSSAVPRMVTTESDQSPTTTESSSALPNSNLTEGEATTAAPQTSDTSGAETTTTVLARSIDDLVLQPVEAGAGFSQPVLMLASPSDERWFVVDQPGVIWTVEGGDASVFLDINDLVQFGGEQGLLGMAFHPGFVENGLFYVNYIANNGDTVVASISGFGDIAERETLTEILRVDQPAGNHNGGNIVFGPDGNLWIGLGDGGGADDQFGQGQRADTMLGSMLRISVGPGIEGYTIPDGNLAGEIWAIGLRNPWRFAFDGDDLWIADVGQNRIEEIDVVEWRGTNPNFGWSVFEGTECFRGGDCDAEGFVAPIYEYPHSEGCSVTGGYVYRGTAMPELHGHYFFADYCTGWLRSVDRDGAVREWLPPGTFSAVIGFGLDHAGELYVLTADGVIFLIRDTG